MANEDQNSIFQGKISGYVHPKDFINLGNSRKYR